MNFLDWTIIPIYLVGLIAMSVALGRKQTTVEDYYLGGNNIPWWAIGLSTMGTQFSTNSFLGIPAFVALGYGGGLSVLQLEMVLPLSVLFVMACLHPFFRRARVISVYEYLEKRFGVLSRTALSVMFQLGRALATGVTIYSVSLVFELTLGIELWICILLIGVFTVIYDTIGGMEAVVWSDVIQVVVILLGVGCCTVAAVRTAGGVAEVVKVYSGDRRTVQVPPESAGTFDLSLRQVDIERSTHTTRAVAALAGMPASLVGGIDVGGIDVTGFDLGFPATAWVQLDRRPTEAIDAAADRLVLTGLRQRFRVLLTDKTGLKKGEDYSFWAMIFGLFFLYVSYYGCDQSQVQRQLSSRDIDEARLSLFMNGIIRFSLMATLTLMGLAIGACLLIDLETNATFIASVLKDPMKQNQMVIHFLLNYLPHGFIGLVVVAIFSAAMSSLDSTLNSLSATSMRDIYQRFINPDPDPHTQMLVSKSLTVFWGTFCTLSAFITPYLGSNVLVIINKMGSITYGPILGTFLLAIFTRRTNDRGALVGMITGVIGVTAVSLHTDISWVWWSFIGTVMTMATGWLASLAGPGPPAEKLEGLIWTRGVSTTFESKRSWGRYYIILVAFFFLYIAVGAAIERIPGAVS